MSRAITTRKVRRSGSALVEAAITLPVLLLIVFGMMDLGMAVLQHNVLAEAARIGAREAIVHGADAAPERAVWDSSSAPAAIRERIAPLLAASAVELDNVTVTVSYEQGGAQQDLNEPGRSVAVTITSAYAPMTSFLQVESIPLTATSRMVIAN